MTLADTPAVGPALTTLGTTDAPVTSMTWPPATAALAMAVNSSPGS